MRLHCALEKRECHLGEMERGEGQTETALGTWQRNSDFICREVGTRWKTSALQDVNNFKDSKM